METFFFGKSRRLLNARDYKTVFDRSTCRASHKHLLILACPNTGNGPRLGIIVAKKNARKAVDRNRLKRIIREQFRLHQHELGNLDLIVLARPGLVKLDNREVAQLLLHLFGKLK